jgi:LacI family transcriptional regulator
VPLKNECRRFCGIAATDCNFFSDNYWFPLPNKQHSMKQEKEITIYDIARQLNISATTVSRGLQDNPAINKLTRKKII